MNFIRKTIFDERIYNLARESIQLNKPALFQWDKDLCSQKDLIDRSFVFYQVSFINYASSTNSSSFNVSLPYTQKYAQQPLGLFF